jgi:quercetin dioxygenase-like cupin family protein
VGSRRREISSDSAESNRGWKAAPTTKNRLVQVNFFRRNSIMIVKSGDGKKKEFLGVSFDVLAVGEMSMVTKMNFKKGDIVPFHRHSNEQSGYIISGKLRFIFGDFDEILNPGDTYSIPVNVKHSIEVIETGTVIDFFVPPRKDYL